MIANIVLYHLPCYKNTLGEIYYLYQVRLDGGPTSQ